MCCVAVALASAIFMGGAAGDALRRGRGEPSFCGGTKPFKEARMNIRMFPIVLLAMVLSLAGCDEEESEATETEEVEEVED